MKKRRNKWAVVKHLRKAEGMWLLSFLTQTIKHTNRARSYMQNLTETHTYSSTSLLPRPTKKQTQADNQKPSGIECVRVLLLLLLLLTIHASSFQEVFRTFPHSKHRFDIAAMHFQRRTAVIWNYFYAANNSIVLVPTKTFFFRCGTQLRVLQKRKLNTSQFWVNMA